MVHEKVVSVKQADDAAPLSEEMPEATLVRTATEVAGKEYTAPAAQHTAMLVGVDGSCEVPFVPQLHAELKATPVAKDDAVGAEGQQVTDGSAPVCLSRTASRVGRRSCRQVSSTAR